VAAVLSDEAESQTVPEIAVPERGRQSLFMATRRVLNGLDRSGETGEVRPPRPGMTIGSCPLVALGHGAREVRFPRVLGGSR
jgi:hypothetical protein